jgi:hypothetical protein
MCVALILHYLQNASLSVILSEAKNPAFPTCEIRRFAQDDGLQRNKKPQRQKLGNCGSLVQVVQKNVRDSSGKIRQTSRRRLFSSFGCKRPQIPSALNSSTRRGPTQVWV